MNEKHVSDAPNCGACPGDGSICPSECRLAKESPPLPDLRGVALHVARELRNMTQGHIDAMYPHLWARELEDAAGVNGSAP